MNCPYGVNCSPPVGTPYMVSLRVRAAYRGDRKVAPIFMFAKGEIILILLAIRDSHSPDVNKWKKKTQSNRESRAHARAGARVK